MKQSSKIRLLGLSAALSFLLWGQLHAEAGRLPRLYVHKIKVAPGISPALESQIRNGIILSILHHFRGKYAIVDDDAIALMNKQVEKLQRQGCSDEACQRQIADALDADELISAELFDEGGRYRLTVKNQLRNATTLQYTIKRLVSEVFSGFQADYFVAEMARAIIDTEYMISRSGAPAAEVGVVDVSQIEIKPVAGADINVLTFRVADDRAQTVVDISRPRLESGDALAKAGDYEKAIEQYNGILNSIQTKLSASTQDKIKNYTKGIEARIQSAVTNIYRVRLESIDLRLKKEGVAGKGFLKEIRNSYAEIGRSYKNLAGYRKNEALEEAIENRMFQVDAALYGLSEKDGDRAYNNYNFNAALLEYESILDSIEKSIPSVTRNRSALETEVRSIRERVSKKIAATRLTGASHLQNRITTLCQHAEKQNFAENFAEKDEEKKRYRSEIDGAMNEARHLLDSTAFADASIRNLYKQTYDLVNRERDLVNHARDQRINFTVRSMLLPGYGQISAKRNGMGTAILMGFLALPAALSISDKNYRAARDSYSRAREMSLLGMFGGLPVLSYMGYEKAMDARQKIGTSASHAASIMTAMAALYLYNVVDAFAFSSAYSQDNNPEVRTATKPWTVSGFMVPTVSPRGTPAFDLVQISLCGRF